MIYPDCIVKMLRKKSKCGSFVWEISLKKTVSDCRLFFSSGIVTRMLCTRCDAYCVRTRLILECTDTYWPNSLEVHLVQQINSKNMKPLRNRKNETDILVKKPKKYEKFWMNCSKSTESRPIPALFSVRKTHKVSERTQSFWSPWNMLMI